jgi:hypothetical protein
MMSSHARLLCVIALGLTLGWPAGASAQSLRVRITDAETGEAVAMALVTLRTAAGRTTARARTDEEGRAQLAPREAGSFLLAVRHEEYREQEPLAVQLRATEELLLELRLSRTLVILDPLEVTGTRHDPRHDATRAGMLARRELFEGRTSQMVLMHGDPEFIAATTVTEVLRRLHQPVRGGCRIFFWEGELVPTATETAFFAGMSPQQVGAVEYYRTWHDAPLAYRQSPPGRTGSTLNCSIIALWSRPDAPRRRAGWWLAALLSGLAALLVLSIS